MPQTRQLAAIMFTDIVGYSALMNKDEEAAFKLLQKNRELHKSAITEISGKWLKEMGDGVLASFNTVSDAVNCALKIQESCINDENISLRIGIHQGEVVFEDNDVFGDGVNIASRIEVLAPAGGIFVSESVSRNINNKKGIETRFVEEKKLKNIEYPVRIYEIIIGLEGNAKKVQISDQKTRDNSIAVLPFVNMSSDPEQDYLCDGLTEEILNILSQLDKLKVASRTSAFSFKGKNEKISQIGKELNVDHVLEGSVRKAGNRIRITAQLIKVNDGFHIWSERYDRKISDIFDIQDEIALAILDSLKVKLLGEEKVKILKHGTDDHKAYQLYLKGILNFHKFTPESFQKAIEYYNEAIEIKPTYAKAYAGMVSCYHILWIFSFLPPDQSAPFMQKAALKSIELDDQLAESQLALGRVKFWYEYDLVEAERRFEKSLQINPNIPDTLGQYGLMLSMSGDRTKALALGAKAVELDPFSPLANLDFTWIQFMCGEYEGMLEQALRMIEIHPNFYFSTACLGHYYWSQSNYGKAIEALELSMKQNYSQLTVSTLGCIYAVAGKKMEARKILSELHEMQKKTSVPNFCYAKIHAGLNEMELAFDYLEKAAVDRADYLVFLDGFRRANLIPTLTDNVQLLEYIERVGIPHHV